MQGLEVELVNQATNDLGITQSAPATDADPLRNKQQPRLETCYTSCNK
jgi:hypothetical protein